MLMPSHRVASAGASGVSAQAEDVGKTNGAVCGAGARSHDAQVRCQPRMRWIGLVRCTQEGPIAMLAPSKGGQSVDWIAGNCEMYSSPFVSMIAGSRLRHIRDRDRVKKAP